MTEAVTQGPVSPVVVGIASKKKRWRSFLLGILILVCGIAIGTGGTVVVMKHIILNAIQHPEKVPQRITDRMRGKLGLTEDQATKLKAILTERQKKIQALLRQVRPEVDKEFEKAKTFKDSVLITESALNYQEVALAFKPREEWPSAFKFYRLYR